MLAGKPTYAQDAAATSDNGLTFSLNADLVNRYLWRGLLYSPNPNVQPYASLAYKGLTFGAWGSYGASTNYAEVDLYLSYSVKQFTLTINDYYNEDETNLSKANYFECRNDSTPHMLEASLTYNGPENFPIAFTAATFFYGNDKDAKGNNYFSTYLEASYRATIGGLQTKLFLGGTIGEGLYADKAAIVNLGIGMSKEIKVTDSFAIPVNASFVINPHAKDAFFIFGITL